ncbi:MAG: hypothetical protein N2509_02740 [Treponemataceae bacterium]|nr:hypothetical protein [Treponemataceae bacterium]
MERNHPSEALGAFQLSLTDRDVYPYGCIILPPWPFLWENMNRRNFGTPGY